MVKDNVHAIQVGERCINSVGFYEIVCSTIRHNDEIEIMTYVWILCYRIMYFPVLELARNLVTKLESY